MGLDKWGEYTMKTQHSLRNIAIIMILVLTACTSKQEPTVKAPTEDEVLATLKEEFHVNDKSVTLTNFELVSQKVEGIHDDVVMTLTLKNGIGEFDLKSSLRFLKTGAVYKLYNIENETLLVKEAKLTPDPNLALRVFESDSNLVSYFNYWFSNTQMEGWTGPTTCVLADPNFKSGTALVDCIDTMEFIDIKGKGTKRFIGSYDYDKGWVYRYDSWSYVETVEFPQPLVFTFPSIMSGSSPFKANETVTLNLSGKVILSYLNTDTLSLENTMTGTLDKDGTLIPLRVELIDTEDDYDLVFYYGDQIADKLILRTVFGGGRCGPSDPNSYSLLDSSGNYANWIDPANRSSGLTTSGETECRTAN